MPKKSLAERINDGQAKLARIQQRLEKHMAAKKAQDRAIETKQTFALGVVLRRAIANPDASLGQIAGILNKGSPTAREWSLIEPLVNPPRDVAPKEGQP